MRPQREARGGPMVLSVRSWAQECVQEVSSPVLRWWPVREVRTEPLLDVTPRGGRVEQASPPWKVGK